MELYTKYSRPPKKKEKGGGKVVVERAGYITAKARIEAMLNAGQRLVSARAKQYHFEDGEKIDEDFIDPTVSPAFDEFAAKDAEMYVARSLKNAQKKAVKADPVSGDSGDKDKSGGDGDDQRSEKVDNQ